MNQSAINERFKAKYRIAHRIAEIPVGRIKQEKASLAEQLGISIAQLNRLIRQDSEPSGTQLRIIADFFGVSVDELYEEVADALNT